MWAQPASRRRGLRVPAGHVGQGGIYVSMLWPPESLLRARHDPPQTAPISCSRRRPSLSLSAICVCLLSLVARCSA
jgi:hypothetical protein